MTLRLPSYELILGSEKWTEQLLSLDLRLCALPLLDVLEVRLPREAAFSARIGDEAKLTLDGGDGASAVFSGRIAAIRRTFTEIRVKALDAGAELARYRPAVTYEKATASTVVRGLCGDAGVDVARLEDGVELAYYAADPSRNALDHVARVCRYSGALACVTAEGKLASFVIDTAQAEVALMYGRDLLHLEQGQSAAPVTQFVVAGESAAGSTSAPEALRPTSDFFGGHRPAGPSREEVWRHEPALRTAQAAQRAGAALDLEYAAAHDSGELEALLDPRLRPGTVVELQSLPAPLANSTVWLSSVRHRLSHRTIATNARFHAGSPGGIGGLLGSLGGLF